MRLHLDTGSSDLWVNTASSRLCKSDGSPCTRSGTYSANKSSSYKYVNSNFQIQYADNSGAQGDFVTDTFKIGDSSIDAFQFAVGYKSSSNESVLGIGYPSNEASVTARNPTTYPNLPYALQSAGVIKSPSYSLWLNDLDASTGTILFGGVNTAKFQGELGTLPIQSYQDQSSPTEFNIALTALDVNDGSKTTKLASGGAFPVLLDSGSSLCYVPDTIFQGLINALNAEFDGSSAFVDCALRTGSGYVDFTFSSPKIRVPMNEIVLALSDFEGGSSADKADKLTKRTMKTGAQACVLGVSPSGGSSNILGDTFLRSAYVVYDLENNQISLAQTNFNSTDDNIMEIKAGSGGVPSASGVSNVATATGTQSGLGKIGTPTVTGTSTRTGAAVSSTSKASAATKGPIPMKYMAAAGVAGAMAILGH